ncbi:hypothetical protein RCL_jg16311.t1 [Rhizophagus clarus]|uniref:Uncharacterized protein n=1 Tax=Rhizophagus clarus TaxID=94130 RepID=A0A8H3LZV5_9GLOM|nr:hypothetical protein RCL_jg16311.t1 [Rhizophagus clarus]
MNNITNHKPDEDINKFVKKVIKITKDGNKEAIETILTIDETIDDVEKIIKEAKEGTKKTIETTLNDDKKIQEARFGIISLNEQYLLFEKNHKLRRNVIAASILVFIISIVMGKLLKMVEETDSANNVGSLFSGLVSAGGLIGTIMGAATYNYAQKRKVDSMPNVTDKAFKPMFLYISDNILKEMAKFIKPYDKGDKKNNDEKYFITCHIKKLKRKNDVLSLENYIGIFSIIISFLYIILTPVFLTLIYSTSNHNYKLDPATDRILRHSIMIVGEILLGFVFFYSISSSLFDIYTSRKNSQKELYSSWIIKLILYCYTLIFFIPIIFLAIFSHLTRMKKVRFKCSSGKNKSTQYSHFLCFRFLCLLLSPNDEFIIKSILNGNINYLEAEYGGLKKYGELNQKYSQKCSDLKQIILVSKAASR